MNYWPVTGAEELNDLKAFLKKNDLPFDDIKTEGNQFGFYRDELGRIVGCGGLEFHGNYCLLRSVAVASEFRRQGHGEEIAMDLVNRAKDKHVSSIYLLTETAQLFFEKHGFRKLPRENAPKEITTSSEFSTVCPVSAVLMSLEIEK